MTIFNILSIPAFPDTHVVNGKQGNYNMFNHNLIWII